MISQARSLVDQESLHCISHTLDCFSSALRLRMPAGISDEARRNTMQHDAARNYNALQASNVLESIH
jgi:hypothetical protein